MRYQDAFSGRGESLMRQISAMKAIVAVLTGLSLLAAPLFADLALLEKFSHKTSFSLEQMVFRAEYILKVKKNDPLVNVKKINFEKKSKCPPYNAFTYNFTVLDVIKGDSNIRKGSIIKVKEPFSDIAYTIHYSYHTRRFVIEPFVGQYVKKMSIDTMDQMLIFADPVNAKNKAEKLLQFTLLNACENTGMKDTVVKILNRPPADMKRLFLKHRKTN